jgi:NADH-quinone oxidoreductase subunit H
MGRAVAGLARLGYGIFAPVVRAAPWLVLWVAILGTVGGLWLGSAATRFVDAVAVSQASGAAEHVSAGHVSVEILSNALRDEGVPAAGMLSYAMWPAQFGWVRDLTGVALLFGLFNLVPAYGIWWERKVSARMQSRLGVMRVGGWHGWAQSPADGVKLMLKEDLVPEEADGWLFCLAPYMAIAPAFVAFVVLPFGTGWWFRDFEVSLLFVVAMLAIEVVAVIIAGWASNNKWSLYGSMREAAQTISYEIPLGMALLVPVLCVGSLRLPEIVANQDGGWFDWLVFRNPFAFAAFGAYFVAALASLKRAPFDLPEAESELVAGYLTEYSGFRWSLFFFAEYAAMFVVSALAVVLFLGGWQSPLPAAWAEGWDTIAGSTLLADGVKGLLFGGPLWLILKAMTLYFSQLWLRWTLPRVRIDQVMYACVQVLLPLTLVLVFGNVLWVWAFSLPGDGWLWAGRVTTWLLGGIGAIFALSYFAVAAYGYLNRRRLVGYLSVDALPGS